MTLKFNQLISECRSVESFLSNYAQYVISVDKNVEKYNTYTQMVS